MNAQPRFPGLRFPEQGQAWARMAPNMEEPKGRCEKVKCEHAGDGIMKCMDPKDKMLFKRIIHFNEKS